MQAAGELLLVEKRHAEDINTEIAVANSTSMLQLYVVVTATNQGVEE